MDIVITEEFVQLNIETLLRVSIMVFVWLSMRNIIILIGKTLPMKYTTMIVLLDRPFYHIFIHNRILDYIIKRSRKFKEDHLIAPLEFFNLLTLCLEKPRGKYIPCTAYTHILTGGSNKPMGSSVVEYKEHTSSYAFIALIWAKIKARKIDKKLDKKDDKGIMYFIREGEIEGG